MLLSPSQDKKSYEMLKAELGDDSSLSQLTSVSDTGKEGGWGGRGHRKPLCPLAGGMRSCKDTSSSEGTAAAILVPPFLGTWGSP